MRFSIRRWPEKFVRMAGCAKISVPMRVATPVPGRWLILIVPPQTGFEAVMVHVREVCYPELWGKTAGRINGQSLSDRGIR